MDEAYQNFGLIKVATSDLDEDVRHLLLLLHPGFGQGQPLLHRQRVVALAGSSVH